MTEQKYNLKKYKSIILDCDGVILNSNKLKRNAFKQVLNEYSIEEINKFLEYHDNNLGISRYKKFEYLFEEILKKKIIKKEFNRLMNCFSKIVISDLKNCEFDLSLYNFLTKYSNHKISVISGSDQIELRKILNKKFDKKFKYIYGSPKTKEENIRLCYEKKVILDPCVFIGDSMIDYYAAKKFNIDFIFKYEWTEINEWKKTIKNLNLKYIKNFRSLI